jgi:hypothetical protein
LFGTEELGQGEDWAIAVDDLRAIAESSSDLPTDAGPPRYLPIMLSRTTPSMAVQGGPTGEGTVFWFYEGVLVDQWPTFEDYVRALIELSRDDLNAVRTDPQLLELLKE